MWSLIMLFLYVWNVNIEKDTVIWKVEIKW